MHWEIKFLLNLHFHPCKTCHAEIANGSNVHFMLQTREMTPFHVRYFDWFRKFLMRRLAQRLQLIQEIKEQQNLFEI